MGAAFQGVALVTGAASGIGRRLAELLVQQGARVVATDLALERLEAVAREGAWPEERTLSLGLDVRDPAQWERVAQAGLARFGRLDLLLNVAGYLKPGLTFETPLEEVARHVDVNAKGVMLGTRVVAAHMVRQGDGHVVNFGSMASLAPITGLALYCASKYAVRAFSLAAAEELRPHWVHVTVVCPDAVQTPMLDLQVGHDEAALTFSGRRVLSVDEVAQAVLGRVLRRRPLEVWLPRSRGWLARFVDVVPALGLRLGAGLRARGAARQRALRDAPRP